MKGGHSNKDGERSSVGERSTTRVLVTGGLWNNLSSFVPIVINLIMTPYVIHGLGIARWGLYVLVSTISVFLGPLNAGIGGSVGRFFAVYAGRDDRLKTTETLTTTFCALLILGAITTILGWFLSPMVIHLFGVRGTLVGEGVFLLRTLAFLVTLSFLHNLFASVINARQRYALTNVTATGSYIIWTAGLISCVHFHLGLRGIAVVFIGQQALATIVIVPSSIQYLARGGVRFLPRSEMMEIWRFARSVQFMSVVQLINEEVDTILVGAIFSLRTLTFFNSGSNFALQLRNLPLNLLTPAGVHLARLYGAEGEEATLRRFGQLQRLWVIGATGWSVAGTCASYYGVVAWLGPQFKLAGWFAVILMIGYFINLSAGMLGNLLSAVGRPDIQMRYASVTIIVNICLTVPLAFTGALGVAAATSIGALAGGIYFMRMVHAKYRHDVPNFISDVPVLAAVLSGATIILLEIVIRGHIPTGALGLFCCGGPAVVGLAVYGLVVCRGSLSQVIPALLRGRSGLRQLLLSLAGEGLVPAGDR
jgi:O-antigen/teichoic acid export membrane protein